MVILMANLHLVGLGVPASALAFLPGREVSGVSLLSWVVHPWVHVSAYHLALDAAAFLVLYPMVASRAGCRLAVVLACGLGSLVGATCDPAFALNGLCGLSGVDHGLMAVVGVGLARGPRGRRAVGGAVVALVVLKGGYELIAGAALLAPWHGGELGQPNIGCHAGGVLAGLLVGMGTCLGQRKRRSPAPGGRRNLLEPTVPGRCPPMGLLPPSRS